MADFNISFLDCKGYIHLLRMSVLNLSSNSVLESFECYMNSLHDFAFLTFFEVCMLGV